MADENLRSTRPPTIQDGPMLHFLFGEFQLESGGAGTDGTSNLFEVPNGFRIVDAYLDVVTAATATAQTIAIQSGANVVIPAADATAAALTRMITGDSFLVDSAAEQVISAVRAASDTVTVSAIIRVLILGFREDANA